MYSNIASYNIVTVQYTNVYSETFMCNNIKLCKCICFSTYRLYSIHTLVIQYTYILVSIYRIVKVIYNGAWRQIISLIHYRLNHSKACIEKIFLSRFLEKTRSADSHLHKKEQINSVCQFLTVSKKTSALHKKQP